MLHRIARRREWHAVALLAALSSCAPDLGARPSVIAPAALQSGRSLSIGPIADAWPNDHWWTRYNDPQLDALVAEALAHSPTVEEAAARVRAARGAAQQAGAAVLPQLDASGEAGLKKQSYNNGIPPAFVPKGWRSYGVLSLAGNFDLDLWGRRRAELAAATSEAVATGIDAQQAAIALETNVVEAYATLGVLFAERTLSAQSVAARQSSTGLYEQRYRAGIDSKLPQEQAKAAEARAKAELEGIDEKIALERHVLAALLGAGPDRGLAIAPPRETGPFARIPLPRDAGIALAGRRADIVAARLRVEAQGRRIDAAKAAFMPNVSLSGLVGLMSLGITKLFDAGSSYGNVAGAFDLPIFDGGRRSGALTQARGKYDELVAAYNATVIDALKEVADALSSRASVERQAAEAEQAAAAASEGYRLADLRYRGGLTNYLDVLSAQTAMLDAQRAALDTRSRLLLTDIQLVRALGGGYADTAAPAQQGKAS